jgi:large subunit ribosomal protein L21e
MPSSNGPRNGTRQKLSNEPRNRGTSPPQRRIQSFDVGETVHLVLDPSVPGGYHPKFSGRTGTVTGQQGSAYRVRVSDGGTEKTVLAEPAHLQQA